MSGILKGMHLTHVTRISDASSFDVICINCGAHDEVPGGWGALADPCPMPPGSKGLTLLQWYQRYQQRKAAQKGNGE